MANNLKNNTMWYIAIIMRTFFLKDESNVSDLKRRLSWETYHLIKAVNAKAALDKAIQIGEECKQSTYVDDDGVEYVMRFMGLREIMPIYDELEDGAEILWFEHQNQTVGKIRRMTIPNNELLKRLVRIDKKRRLGESARGRS